MSWLGLAFGGGAIAFGSGALAVCLGYYIGAHHQRRKDHPMTATAPPDPAEPDPATPEPEPADPDTGRHREESDERIHRTDDEDADTDPAPGGTD